jgi:GTP-binding protein Era
MQDNNIRSGFVGLLGRTNVGKSTLINKIIKKKILITSDKVQTTRNRINCILNTSRSQIIFVDSPGFFKPRNLLQKRLKDTAASVADDVDVIVVVADAAGGIGKGDRFVFEQIKNSSLPKILLVNKTDMVEKEKYKKDIIEIEKEGLFDNIIEVSAKTGENLGTFIRVLEGYLPVGPRYFDEDMVCDQPLEDTISEIVREKLFKNLSQEIPHSITVEVDNIKESNTRSGDRLTSIECSIYTEKNSQKAIIIGDAGSMLKKTGSLARKELEGLLGTRVFLQLWVKVRHNWTREEEFLDRFGY